MNGHRHQGLVPKLEYALAAICLIVEYIPEPCAFRQEYFRGCAVRKLARNNDLLPCQSIQSFEALLVLPADEVFQLLGFPWDTALWA